MTPLHLINGLKNLKIVSSAKELKQPAYLYILKQPYYSKLHTAVVKELVEKVALHLSK